MKLQVWGATLVAMIVGLSALGCGDDSNPDTNRNNVLPDAAV